MTAIYRHLRTFLREERGIEVVEWAIIIGLVTVGLMATLAAIGLWMNGKYSEFQQALGKS